MPGGVCVRACVRTCVCACGGGREEGVGVGGRRVYVCAVVRGDGRVGGTVGGVVDRVRVGVWCFHVGGSCGGRAFT